MKRSRQQLPAVLAALGWLSAGLTPPSAVAATARRATPASAGAAMTPPPQTKPDRALYQTAKKLEKNLRASSRMKAKRTEWEKVAAAYRKVVHRYPRSPYCDDALLFAGNLQREMGKRFRSTGYSDQSLESYALIVSEYPGSRLGEQALFATYEILTARNRQSEARTTAAQYVSAYPKGPHVGAMKKAVAPSKGTPSSANVQIFGIRFWSGEASTRVVVDLDQKVEIKQARLQSPPRLFIDFIGTRLHPNLVGKSFPVGNAFLKQIRIGVNRKNVVRVVIDFAEASGHNVFFLANPDRLVIDVRGEPQKRTSLASAAPTEPAMENVPVTQPQPVEPKPESTPAKGETTTPPEPRPAATAAVTSTHALPPIKAGALPTPSPAPPGPRTAPPTPAATAPPVRNGDGSYSLARQLGLGARRICLDAGHGGHDPGAIGKGGTQEKDVTLSIVKKLEKLIRTELGADVVLTRDSDVYIPLEERTAIANSSGADLFLSVHINSARNRTGRGLETYYLSFAKSAAAEELAARENAISQATMKDLNNLVKAIATNSKIDESRDFAGIIQREHMETLTPAFPGIRDRGVHTAPFYVLIGANMPSILTEVGFVSNPSEERWLKSNRYQERLARSLLEGIRSYLEQLNRGQATRLGGRPGVRVAAKGQRAR